MSRLAFWSVLVLALVLLSMLHVAAVSWRSPAFYTDCEARVFSVPIMTMEEYGEVIEEHPRPYVVEIDSGGGAALLYGAEHSRNPDHPQNDDIRERWQAFAPTAALVEGRLGFLMPGFMDPVGQYGEGGLVFDLARRAGLPVWSWEPPRRVELASMLERWPAEKVALFYVLRPYFGTVRHGVDDPEGFVEPYRRRRTSWSGLEGNLASMAELDAAWKRHVPAGPDWREVDDQWGLPDAFGPMGSRGNAVRDEHLASVVCDLVDRGHRVFAVMGSSHAVKLDAAMRALLANPR